MMPVRLSLVIAVALTSVASAQPGPYGNNGKAQRVPIEGKLQGTQGTMAQVIDDQGRALVFQLPQAGLRFKAPMKPESLAKGMLVRVEAPATGGKFLEPHKSLEVIVPDPSKMNTPIERAMQTPGVYPLSQLLPKQPGQMANPNVRVIGIVVGVEPGKVAVNCGGKPMVLELADPVRIEYLSNNLQFAQQGDRVRGSGQMNNGQLYAMSLEVTGSKPIGNDAPAQQMPLEAMKLRVKEKSKSKSKKEAPESSPPALSPEGSPAGEPAAAAPEAPK